MSTAEDIMDRLVARVRSIDGAAYSGTLYGTPYSGTYTFDLSDPDRVVRGMDGPAIPPPYANVAMRLAPAEPGTNLCKIKWLLSVEIIAVASVGGSVSGEQRPRALELANDIVVAVMADRDAQVVGSLRALGVESIIPGVADVHSDQEGLDVAACMVSFDMEYQTSGIGL